MSTVPWFLMPLALLLLPLLLPLIVLAMLAMFAQVGVCGGRARCVDMQAAGGLLLPACWC